MGRSFAITALASLLFALGCVQTASAQLVHHRLHHHIGLHRHINHLRHRVPYVSRYHGLHNRHYGIGGYYGISNRYSYGVHHRLHHGYYRSPVSYTYRYHNYPSYYSGYRTHHLGRVISPYYRRGPSTVSFYFSSLPYYRPTFYHHHYYSYPARRRYYYDATLCYPFSYSASRVYASEAKRSLLLPPPRITTGDSLLTSFASTVAPSVDRLDTALASTSTASLERLREFKNTSSGDAYFAAGQYLAAIKSYSTAVEAAPTESEGLYRLGHALVAAGQYETAARAFKSALAVSTTVERDSFQLSDLYGSAITDKSVHLDQLAKYALENPRDADALFLVGLFLHYDGQKGRAHRIFDRAVRLDARSEPLRRMLNASTLTET